MRSKLHPLSSHIFKSKVHIYYLFIILFINLSQRHCSIELFREFWGTRYIQSVSEIRELILTSGRNRQFRKYFSITFCTVCKRFPRFLTPSFYQTSSFM
jgi:hypothetical protein